MLIDIHAHVFPDKVAPHAIAKLTELARANLMIASTDGTFDGLCESMRLSGIDYSLNLPVATSVEQFESINRYASTINGKNNVFSFGSLHPDCEDVENKLDQIKALGLRGIKLHPDYQACYIDDPRYLRITEHCLKIGLYILFHCGWDAGYPDPMHCTAERFRKAVLPLLEKYHEEKNPHIILAHLGGVTSFEETKKYICGLPVYLDTAYTMRQIDEETILSVIRQHSAERVMFGTDSPWQSQIQNADRFRKLPLTDHERELISYVNAAHVLGLDK